MADQRPLNKAGITIHSEADFAGMHKAGRLAAEVLDMIGEYVVPGVTTSALDQRCQEYMEARGGQSATIGYRGYEHATCISLNHVVCHGIPGDKVVKEGDILNIDFTTIVDGWFGDNSRMYVAGKPSVKAARLMKVTHDALMKGIEQVRPGNTFGDIGAAIQEYAEAHRLGVVRDFCGHGLGRVFHSKPNVLHYGRYGSGPVLEEGMFFTIEPMLNIGRSDTKTLSDGWTAVTRDKSLSAQFEHSLGVTGDGFDIFTISPDGVYDAALRQ